MKGILNSGLTAALLLVLFSCKNGDVNESDKTVLKTQTDSVSYSIGLEMGRTFKEQGWDTLNTDLLARAIQEKMTGDTANLLSEKESQQIVRSKMRKLQQKKLAENKKEGKDFLKKNKQKEDVNVTESGLQYKVLEKGSGKSPGPEDTVSVHYKGMLVDGEVFESSYERGKPVTFPVNGVIEGWTEGLQMMKEGAKWKFFIPSDLAYGQRGKGRKIKPNATLIFEIELLSVK